MPQRVLLLVKLRTGQTVGQNDLIPGKRKSHVPLFQVYSHQAVGNVTLHVFAPFTAVPPAALILILANRFSMQILHDIQCE